MQLILIRIPKKCKAWRNATEVNGRSGAGQPWPQVRSKRPAIDVMRNERWEEPAGSGVCGRQTGAGAGISRT